GLKNSGLFILESYTPKQIDIKTGGPNNIDFLMTKIDLLEELNGLNFTILQETTREIQEGQGHNGMSAVVQVLANKIN
ncbi:MAG: hypothetical protein Q7U04_01370, partial [Bacteriovorax sp.]|nr:hypothetical protein [Bacteriovorax sp.]